MSSECGHPDPAVLHAYLAGRLDAAGAEHVRLHLLDCEPCRRAVERLLGESTPGQATPFASGPTRPDGGVTLGETWPMPGPPPEEQDDYSTDLRFLPPSDNPAALGQIGEYEVLSVLGRGGMGLVLKAFDLTLHRTVAIKVLSPQLATSPKALRRFTREARAAGGINHPNVVTIHAVVKEQTERPYLVMEYVRGRTLRERVRASPPLDMLSILRISAQIAAGLAAAHRQGVVHRDIKPTNIMLEDGIERVKITDFGLARVTEDVSELTSLEHAVGTPAYMSPEQVRGQSVDPRSDLFGLGCVMYAMATGRSPFHGGHPVEVAHKILEHVPRRLDELNPSIPKPVADLVARLLEKDPNDRFQSADEVQGLLQQQVVALAQSQSQPTLKIPVEGRKGRRGRPRVIGSLVGALLALAVVVVVAVRSWLPVPTPPPLPPGTTELRELVTVAQSGEADCRGLREALGKVRPGGTIRVSDDAEYQESVVLDNPAAWGGVTIEAQGSATIAPPPGEGVGVQIAGTPQVTVRGLRFHLGRNQHALRIVGDAAGVTLEKLTIVQPTDSAFAAIHAAGDAHGTPEQPIRIRQCRLRSGGMGVVIGGEAVAHVSVEDNYFESAAAMNVLVGKTAQGIAITGNVFLEQGVAFTLSERQSSRSIRVGNNTFWRVPHWLDLSGTELVDDVVICNNLVLGSEGINARVPLEELAKQWSFRNNWWEPGPGTDVQGARLVAELHAKVDLVSREPGAAGFLRPPAGSPLTSAGAGGEFPAHIGAFPAAAEEAQR